MIILVGMGMGTDTLTHTLTHEVYHQLNESGICIVGCDMGTGTDYSPDPCSYHNYSDALNRAVSTWEDLMKEMKMAFNEFLDVERPLFVPYKSKCKRTIHFPTPMINRKMMYSKSGFVPKRSKHKR